MIVIKTKEIPHTNRNKYLRTSSSINTGSSSSSHIAANLNGIDTETLKAIIRDLSNRIYYLEKEIFDSVGLTPPDYFKKIYCYVQRWQERKSGGVFKPDRSSYPKVGPGWTIR